MKASCMPTMSNSLCNLSVLSALQDKLLRVIEQNFTAKEIHILKLQSEQFKRFLPEIFENMNNPYF